MWVRAIGTGAMRAMLLGGVAAWGLAGPAGAQMQTREGIALQNQILELQRELQVLGQRGGAGSYPGYPPPGGYPPPNAAPFGASSDVVARLLTRVDSLEGAVRELRGRVEELSNRLQQQTAQLSKQIEDLQFQMQNPQGGGQGASAGASAGASGGSPSAPPAASIPPSSPSSAASRPAANPPPSGNGRRTPELILQQGQGALQQGDFGTAEQDAREVLANRASPRAYDAQFLLAQALLGQKQYSQAAIAYDDAYNRQKKGSHAQDSLLGLADALVAINEKRAACDTLAKLRTEFPTPAPDVRDRSAQIGRRAGCR